MPVESSFHYAPPPLGPEVVHVDDALIACVKPSGLLSVPGRAEHHRDSVLRRLQASHGELWVVHRLDMDTSGLMVLARTAAAAGALGRQFERREVNKRYIAWVWGRVQANAGSIGLPLAVDWPHRPRQQVNWTRGKPSVTNYAVLQRTPSRTLLALTPHTGRSHQLRVHLAAIGHPICGDRFYGLVQEPTPTLLASGAPGVSHSPRLALHAEQLELTHPVSGDRVSWRADPDWGAFNTPE